MEDENRAPGKHCLWCCEAHSYDRKKALTMILHKVTVISSSLGLRSHAPSLFKLFSVAVLQKWNIKNRTLSKHCLSYCKADSYRWIKALTVILHKVTVISSSLGLRWPTPSLFMLFSVAVLQKWNIQNRTPSKYCLSYCKAHYYHQKNALTVILHKVTVISSSLGLRWPAPSLFKLFSVAVIRKWKIKDCAHGKHCP
jgi:NAD-dependent dihydropyrimidine dehydrogenase PreA subunit